MSAREEWAIQEQLHRQTREVNTRFSADQCPCCDDANGPVLLTDFGGGYFICMQCDFQKCKRGTT